LYELADKARHFTPCDIYVSMQLIRCLDSVNKNNNRSN